MTVQKSRKRSAEETRGRQVRRAEQGKLREAAQYRCFQANLQAGKLRDSEVADILARHERGEVYRTIGKAYGLDEFTVARVVKHGKLAPWQQAQAKRDKERKPKQLEWAKRHGSKDQLPAS